MASNIADLFEAVAETAGGRTAVVGGGDRLTYAELDARAERLARALAARGVVEGSTVAVALRNRPDHLTAYLAAFKRRAVPVNVNLHYVTDELRRLYAAIRPTVAFVEPDRVAVTAAALASGVPTIVAGEGIELAVEQGDGPAEPVTRSGDDRFVIYTGGTTGGPKGVEWRHADLIVAALGCRRPDGGPFDTADAVAAVAARAPRTLVASPLMHGTALWTALANLVTGGTVFLDASTFDPNRVWRIVDRERITRLAIVGDAFGLPLVDTLEANRGRWSVDSLLVVSNGGAPLSRSVREALIRLIPGVVVVDGYGTSETGGHGRWVDSAGSCRHPGAAPRFVMNADTAVLDEDLRPVVAGSGSIGRVARRGAVPVGYRDEPEASARTFPVVDGVRWALTGDLASVERDGTVTLLGRSERVINTGGEKVFADEIELVLRTHPSIADAIVVGEPDDRFGRQVVAVVEVQPGCSLGADELVSWCRGNVARFKVPRRVVFVDRAPRTPAGKPDPRSAAALLDDD
ncbi:MAG: AMP-binding protein [Actinomycetota bacterium]|nr:AMP-binding protein [Actinomycetota bacterium]